MIASVRRGGLLGLAVLALLPFVAARAQPAAQPSVQLSVQTSIQPAAQPAALSVPAGYTLVWSDDFNVPGAPDAAKWSFDTERNKAGWHNHELQYYSRDRTENAEVRDGKLVITARKEALASAADWGRQRYTSARLLTRGKAAWTYGFFEIRAKLPCGKGTWPAIWLLGSQGGWPAGGELDIAEHIGHQPGRVDRKSTRLNSSHG